MGFQATVLHHPEIGTSVAAIHNELRPGPEGYETVGVCFIPE
jgi:hypothetical protein